MSKAFETAINSAHDALRAENGNCSMCAAGPMASRKLWIEAFRLARLTPCVEGVNLTWMRAYPYRIWSGALMAAWTGDHGDALNYGIRVRATYHRAGISRDYILHRSANPRLPA